MTPVGGAQLPERTDVAVIGGGYTGLAAARALSQRGARAVVLERSVLGGGASGRNGGMVLPGFKADPAELVRRVGRERARALFDDTLAAIRFVEALVRDEAIECDWRCSGHITLAARPGHLRPLAATARLLARDFGYRTELLGPEEVRKEIGSTRYHGGLLDPAAGSLQPAAYLSGLVAAARRAGAVLCDGTAVVSMRRSGTGFRLATGHGTLEAREVIVATDGHTGGLVPWLQRRTVPVGSYILATERLTLAEQRRLVPGGRMLSDTKNLLYYFRLSPDGRLVFGGRAAFVPEALAKSAALLREGMLEVFPELAPVAIEFAWGGTVGFTRDNLPHAGRHEGIAYALGYGGHGVAFASWLGDRVGRAVAGEADWPELATVPFRAVPLYHGRPWFLPLAGMYYGLKDRLT